MSHSLVSLRSALAIAGASLYLFSGTVVNAQTTAKDSGQTRTQLGDVLEPKRFDEDKRITDLELKAQSGSLSRYSLKFSLSLSGPPVNNLADPNRPNPDNRPGDQRTSLGGSAGFRYRISSNQAVNLGTGVRWFTPVQAIKGEEVKRSRTAKNYDINDPYIGFDQTYASGSAQMRTSARFAKTTSEYYTRNGQFGTIGFDQGMKFNLGKSRWVLGLMASADYFIYERPYRDGDGTRLSKYYLSTVPSVEYKVSPKLNANVSFGHAYGNLRTDKSWWRWEHPLSSWRLGLGWAVKRDIYLNPYLSFYAEKPSFNSTSASLNAVFSIF